MKNIRVFLLIFSVFGGEMLYIFESHSVLGFTFSILSLENLNTPESL